MQEPLTFGPWLKQHRRALDWTQQELAERAACSLSSLRKIEAGELMPSRELALLLATALNVPGAEQEAFVAFARAGQSTPMTPPAVAPTSRQPAPPIAALSPHRPHLPPQLTTFIGRTAEVRDLCARLTSPECGLLTIVGPGGMGKTRLALAVAHALAAADNQKHAKAALAPFPDGVYFIDFSGIKTPSFMAVTLSEGLGLSLPTIADPTRQLLDHLVEKQLLLVLDNLEHLLEGVGLLLALLQAAPAIKLLVTSRERLAIQGEWVFDLPALATPPTDAPSPTPVVEYDAVTLFVDRARRVRKEFALSAQNEAAVAQICRLVDGMPLGIELAASWVHILSCQEIADEIARTIDFLTATRRNLPERHRSLRATFDYSWQLLTAAEQVALQQLTVFPTTFTAAAAAAVADVRLGDLLSLINKSLLQIDSSPNAAVGAAPSRQRYKFHAVLHQYAKEKLTDAATLHALRDRHCAYYSRFVADQEKALKNAHVAQALSAIGDELSNLQASWRHAVRHLHLDFLEQSVGGLLRFLLLRGPLLQAQEELELTLEHLQRTVDKATQPTPALEIFLSKLLVIKAEFLNERGLYEQAVASAQAAVALAQRHQVFEHEAMGYLQWGIARQRQAQYAEARRVIEQSMALAASAQLVSLQADARRGLGRIAIYQGDYSAARAQLQQAWQSYQGLGELLAEVRTMHSLAVVEAFTGDYERSKEYYERCVQTYRTIGNQTELGTALNSLGAIYAHLGDYPQARRYYEESLAIRRQTGGRHVEGQMLANLGLLWHHLAENERAITYSTQAVQSSRELGERDAEAYALTCLGHAQAACGEFLAATQSYQQALTLRQTLQQGSQALEPLAGLAQVALATGDLSTAQTQVAAILPVLTTRPLAGIVELLRIYLVCYRVLAASNDPRADSLLAKAYAIVQTRSEKIRDPALRASFCEKVAAHREILAAYQQLAAREDGD